MCNHIVLMSEDKAETPGVKPNPFKSLFCFRGIKGKSEEKPEEDLQVEEVDGEGQAETETITGEEPLQIFLKVIAFTINFYIIYILYIL